MKKLIMFVMVLMLCLGTAARAQYTDYIGAGQDDDIVATASSEDTDSPTEGAFAQNTVNGSGLTGDAHDILWENTWTSFGTEEPAASPNPAREEGTWILYDLGHVYGLGLMHVWNCNEATWRSLKDVTIDYSVYGTNWTELGSFTGWPEAPGENDYTGFEGPDFAGASAQYVLITVDASYDTEEGWAALSEIKIEVGAVGLPNPIIIDASDTTVYEPTVLPPLDGEGNFTVCLRNQPEPGADVTVIIDPNGPAGGQGNPDLTLDDNDGSPDYTVTLTFDPCDWDEPQTVSFVAVDDSIPEPEGEGYNDAHGILVSSYYPEHPEDANYVGMTQVKVTVIDNDKANILFSYTPLEATSPVFAATGPVELFEQGSSPTTQWRNIGISLQTPPTGDDPVKLQVVVEGDIEGDNLPLTDPCLPFEEIDEPNGLFFTAGNYNVSQPIRIWGNDDAELQVLGEEGGYPSYEGAQDYQAALVVTVVDGGGDDGYQWLVPILDEFGEPTGEYETVSMEREIDFDIEDNECGAFGILDTDVGNPNAFTDPNYTDDDGNPLPDCYVDIYDAIEMVTRWLVCTDPQNPSCWE